MAYDCSNDPARKCYCPPSARENCTLPPRSTEMNIATLKLSAADLHVLRSLLTQTNAPGSFQRRMIKQIDAALDELSRSRRPR